MTQFDYISLRPLLVGRLSLFLRARDLHGGQLPEFLAELAGSITRYREEGKRLFPVVFLCRDLDQLLTECGGEDPIELGSGDCNVVTARRMLKLCAPLGEGRSWVVFAEAKRMGVLRFGVFRAPRSAAQPTALERIRASTNASLAAVGIAQLSEGVIEVRASCGQRIFACLDGSAAPAEPPTQVIKDFIESLRLDAPSIAHDALGRFYYRVLIDVMQVWHGTLAAVVPVQATQSSSLLADGTILSPVLDVTAHIIEHLRDGSEATALRLSSDANLIRGMLSADGITVFRSDGAVVGYNAFLLRSSDSPLGASPSLGGARQRAFAELSNLVGGELVAAFCRSQDGNAFCRSSWSLLRAEATT